LGGDLVLGQDVGLDLQPFPIEGSEEEGGPFHIFVDSYSALGGEGDLVEFCLAFVGILKCPVE